MYVNECKPSFTKAVGGFKSSGKLPAGLDIISFDSYELTNLSSFAPTPWWYVRADAVSAGRVCCLSFPCGFLVTANQRCA